MSDYTREKLTFQKETRSLVANEIFKKKLRIDGSIEKHKARQVIKGFT